MTINASTFGTGFATNKYTHYMILAIMHNRVSFSHQVEIVVHHRQGISFQLA